MELEPAHLAAAAVSFGAGWAIGRWSEKRQLLHLEALRRREREEADKAVAGLRREMVDAVARRDEQVLAFQALPDLVEEMFRVPTRRAVIPLLLKLVDALLRPEQATVFVARPAQKRLALAEGLGLTGSLKPGAEVEFGQGRVGYVAENLVAMDDADFRGARGEGTTRVLDVQRHLAASDQKDLRADAAAPVLAGEQVFAVVTAGGARQRRGMEKRLVSMAAALATAAISHADARAAAEEGAQVDGMTGLLNRRSLEQRLDAEIVRAEREETRLSLLMLDVDDLRHYNHNNGHQQGDEVLRRLATLLRSSVRAEDLVGRFGGEELVVVFPGADKETGMRLGEQIRRAVETYPFPFRGLQPAGSVTVSGGVATYPEDSRVGRDLLRCADQAMLEAKREGRNRVHPAEPNYLT